MRYFKRILFIYFLSYSAVYSQSIDSTLFKAYEYNSKIILDEFFMNWEKSKNILNDEQLSEINKNKITNDTLKEIYNIAYTFYNPVHSEVKYSIFEDTLRYNICYTDSLPYDYRSNIEIIESNIPSLRLNSLYDNKFNILYILN